MIMLDLVVIVTVDEPSKVDRVVWALSRMRSVVLAEPGCVSWEALRSESDPSRIVLVERWESRDAWEKRDSLDGIQKIYIPDVLPYVSREVHVSSRLGLLSSE
jgi:quinol monooxygenase YgiN